MDEKLHFERLKSASDPEEKQALPAQGTNHIDYLISLERAYAKQIRRRIPGGGVGMSAYLFTFGLGSRLRGPWFAFA